MDTINLFDEIMAEVKLNSAYFCNKHIDKKLEIQYEEDGGDILAPHPVYEGHWTWRPF